MRKTAIFSVLFLVIFCNDLFALETETHQALNSALSNITTPEGFNLDSYLKKNLGLEKGIKEVVSENNSIKDWLSKGGLFEDVPAWYLPYVRSVNHFHDPLSNKGLKGIANSSIQWALMPNGTQTVGGNYSWFDARDYFYQALTGKDKTIRNEYYGKTFRALGQLTHLVQDISVPAHARDDGHIVTTPLVGNYQYYEKWVKANANIGSLTSNPVFFDLSALSKPNPLGSVPIANLFDTNTFTGIDPSVSTRKNIGLSEYTNPNFLSDDTMFTDGFLYPSKKWLELWTDNSVKRKYLRKMYEGEPVNHLAAVSWLYWYRLRYFSQGDQYLPVGLDPECHMEYASKLIPHAVGYSAGLLNYFFRGEMDMAPDEATGSGYVIVNNTDEDMSGTFELLYDNTSDNRIKLQSWPLSIGKKSSGNNKSTNITFTPPTNAKEPDKYMLVYRGNLGNEENAVVGKEISLIPPLVFLIYQDAQNNPVYAVWRIENNGYSIKSYDFNLSVHLLFTISYGTKGWPSTVKSNRNLNSHAMLRQFEELPLASKLYARAVATLFGLRNSFRPLSKEDKTEIFDSNISYVYYPLRGAPPLTFPYYVCSGRNPWYFDKGDNLITDIEAWETADGVFKVRYKENGGDFVWGAEPLPITSISNINAVLSKDKIIWRDVNNPVSGSSGLFSFLVDADEIYSPIFVKSCFAEQGYGPIIYNLVPSGVWKQRGDIFQGSFYSYSNTVPLKFGEAVIAQTGNGGYYGEYSGLSVYASQRGNGIGYPSKSCKELGSGLLYYITPPCVNSKAYTQDYWEISYGSFNPTGLMDYDNDNVTIDKTFIVFLSGVATSATHTKMTNLLYGQSGEGTFYKDILSSESFTGSMTIYRLVYRLNGGSVHSIDIALHKSGQRTSGSAVPASYDPCGYPQGDLKPVSSNVEYNLDYGERISNASSKVTENYLAYSYILETKASSGEWIQSKRILGLINRENGNHQKFDITSSDLEKFPGFDKFDFSGVGIHKK